MTKLSLSRRTFLGGAAASPFVLSGLIDPARAADITVGIVYVGSRQDYGWNQAHAVGAKALTVKAGDQGKTYGDTLALGTVAFTTDGLVNGDEVTVSPQFNENILSFAVPYGLALQGLKLSKLQTNLLPHDIRMDVVVTESAVYRANV